MKYFLFRAGLFLLLLYLPDSGVFAQAFRRFSNREGAPETTVQGIVQDRDGFVWFASTQGLFRYDTQTFKAYLPAPDNPGSIASHYIQDVFCDSKGILWVATWSGLSRYDRQTDSFTNFRHDPKDIHSISSDIVYSITEDSLGNIWAGTSKGLNQIKTIKGRTIIRRYTLDELGGQTQVIRCIAEGPDGMLWLGTHNGLVRMRKDGSERRLFRIAPEKQYGAVIEFLAIYIDKAGKIWLGSNREGLILFDRTTERFQPVESFRKKDGGLPNVARIIPDDTGKLWVATLSGLAHFDPASGQLRWFTNRADNQNSLHDDLLYTVFRDRQGGIWTGGYFRGISYMYPGTTDFLIPSFGESFIPGWMGQNGSGQLWGVAEDRRKAALFEKGLRSIRFYDLQLPSPINYNSFYLDPAHVLWCGGNSVLTSFDLNTRQRRDYPLARTREGVPIQDKIKVIYEDKIGRFWIGGRFGLLLFDAATGTFSNKGLSKNCDFSATTNNTVRTLIEDSKGNLWAGGDNQAFLLKNGSFCFERIAIEKKTKTDEPEDLEYIREDDSGRIWFASYTYGLLFYSPDRRLITKYRGVGNILRDYVTDLQPDSKGYLWLNSESKLIRYHIGTGSKQYYDAQDGLPPDGYIKTSVKDEDGTLYYGTNKGMFWFNPERIAANNRASPIVITSLKLFNHDVKIGDSTGLLKAPMAAMHEIVFRDDQDVFTLSFALLNFRRSDRNQFAYKLEGFDKRWNYVGSPSATYTNLPAGRYTFLVKASNGDGYWNKEPLRLDIVVLPPWWKTWYAMIAYLLILAGLVYAITRFFWLRNSFRKEYELYQSKLDFFTNVSHEIRTHLSLIGGPLEKAFQSSTVDTDIRTSLTHAKNSWNRLLNLVNELLDFRKIQSGSASIQVGEYDVVQMLKNVLSAFEHVAAEKGMSIQLLNQKDPEMLWFDMSELQKVFYNLLSNACKFTPEGGNINVVVTNNPTKVVIQVIDNGRGIAPEYMRNLFTNFFQVYDANEINTGYGIGLALSKAIVEQHHGELSVTSKLTSKTQSGETCFTVKLPKGKGHFTTSQLSDAQPNAYYPLENMETQAASFKSKNGANRYTLLFIEDNDELRAFQRECFRDRYHILEANNGQGGLEIAKEYMPDLIVCDIMMPGISGLEVCNRLRSDMLICHIPVILLSAKGTTQQVMEGLKTGADDYLVKPFDLGVLELKINNLIQIRETLRQSFGKSMLLEPESIEPKDLDGEFITKLKNIVLENISDPRFGVNEMAFQIGISISVLYRKLRSLTGMTVNEFMKTIRMKRAMQLLESGTYNVSEVAVIVGFENIQYFSREFKKVYEKTPNEIRKKSVNSEGEIL